MGAGLRARRAAFTVHHVEGALFGCFQPNTIHVRSGGFGNKHGENTSSALFTAELGGPPGPRPPTRMGALMGILGHGGTHAHVAHACAVARVFDAEVHKGVEVNQVLTVDL